MPFKAVRTSVRAAATPPAPQVLRTLSQSSFSITVIFDQLLQLGAGTMGANLPDAISNRPGFSHRNLNPAPTWAIVAGTPDRVVFSRSSAGTTGLAGRVHYEPSAGAVLVGISGVPVAAFDLPVPFN